MTTAIMLLAIITLSEATASSETRNLIKTSDMNKKQLFAAILLLLATNVASFLWGYHKNDTMNYEAACLQADFIHSLMDSPAESRINGSEVEESYYEWFQDLDCGIYNTKELTSIEQLEEYGWGY